MIKLKNIYVIIALIVLMITRVFVCYGDWFSTVVIAGFLVALFDIISKLYLANRTLVIDKQKIRYAVIFIILNLIFVSALILLIINAIINLEFFSKVVVLDEITLLTLLISLPQNLIIEAINRSVRK